MRRMYSKNQLVKLIEEHAPVGGLSAGEGIEIDDNNKINIALDIYDTGIAVTDDTNVLYVKTGDGLDINIDNEVEVDFTEVQPKLTAGTNITISDDNVISASGSGGSYTAGSGITIDDNNAIGVKLYTDDPPNGLQLIPGSSGGLMVNWLTTQPRLIAGSGITIDSTTNVISATGGGGGDVRSVNGKTGAVVLNASDIRATNTQTIQQNLERIDDRIDDLPDTLPGYGLKKDPHTDVIDVSCGDGLLIDEHDNLTIGLGEGMEFQNDGHDIGVDFTEVQQKLIAGSNITISGNTISATGGGGGSYVAGNGIFISGNTISTKQGRGMQFHSGALEVGLGDGLELTNDDGAVGVDFTEVQAKLTGSNSVIIDTGDILRAKIMQDSGIAVDVTEGLYLKYDDMQGLDVDASDGLVVKLGSGLEFDGTGAITATGGGGGADIYLHNIDLVCISSTYSDKVAINFQFFNNSSTSLSGTGGPGVSALSTALRSVYGANVKIPVSGYRVNTDSGSYPITINSIRATATSPYLYYTGIQFEEEVTATETVNGYLNTSVSEPTITDTVVKLN